MLTVDEPAQVSDRDSSWFSSTGVALVGSAHLTACLLAQLKQVRDDFPYLQMSGADDTRLASLLLQVQIAFRRDLGVYFATQPSIGEDMWLREAGRVLTYREFCMLLRRRSIQSRWRAEGRQLDTGDQLG